MLLPGEILVDNFAGYGGASQGIEDAFQRPVDIAINHNPHAIEMHKINHPNTEHRCENVWDVDPVEVCRGRPVGFGWFSPDCKHFSKAKGSTPVDQKIRGLAWNTVRWGLLVPMREFSLENVEEFKTWGPLIETSPGKFKPCPERKGETFKAFIQALTTGLSPKSPAWREMSIALGIQYNIELKLKIYKGLGYTIAHNVMSMCDYGAPTTRKRFFMYGRNDGQPIKWPEKTHGKKGTNLLPFLTTADHVIDWSIPVKSIFGRKKPLVEKTLTRIAKGLDKFVFNCEDPFIVPGELTTPFITEHANSSSQRNMSADEPLRTICSQVKGGHFALVTSHMIKFRGDNLGHRTDEPLHTISAGGFHLGEVRAYLMKYYGTSVGHSCNQPLNTVTTKDRFALVTIKGVDYQIADIGMRMLQPHELFAAMTFPDSYITNRDSQGKKVSKAKQVAGCGNSVPPMMAKLIILANATNQQGRIAA